MSATFPSILPHTGRVVFLEQLVAVQSNPYALAPGDSDTLEAAAVTAHYISHRTILLHLTSSHNLLTLPLTVFSLSLCNHCRQQVSSVTRGGDRALPTPEHHLLPRIRGGDRGVSELQTCSDVIGSRGEWRVRKSTLEFPEETVGRFSDTRTNRHLEFVCPQYVRENE